MRYSVIKFILSLVALSVISEASMVKLREMLPVNPFVIPAEKVSEVLQAYGLRTCSKSF